MLESLLKEKNLPPFKSGDEMLDILLKEEYGYTYWSVLTDKGKVKFTSASGSAGAVIQDGNRVIIKDSDENRFEIEDITALSSKEMKKLDLYL